MSDSGRLTQWDKVAVAALKRFGEVDDVTDMRAVSNFCAVAYSAIKRDDILPQLLYLAAVVEVRRARGIRDDGYCYELQNLLKVLRE